MRNFYTRKEGAGNDKSSKKRIVVNVLVDASCRTYIHAYRHADLRLDFGIHDRCSAFLVLHVDFSHNSNSVRYPEQRPI